MNKLRFSEEQRQDFVEANGNYAKEKSIPQKELTEADDRRNLSELGIANALRDGKACDGEASHEVRPKQPQIISR